ncbi:MAG: hypothetical protein IJD60_10450 [Clostridia bacterium]|nr:hypothetical protein [Clostridia bacterium]
MACSSILSFIPGVSFPPENKAPGQPLTVARKSAPVAAAVELFTRRGLDTITVPIAASVLLFIAAVL